MIVGQTLYFGSLFSKDTGEHEEDGVEEAHVDNVGNELVLEDLTSLVVVVGSSASNAADRSTLSFSPSKVGGQNRTRLLDLDRRSLVSSSNADDLVRGCDRPRDRDSRRPLDDDRRDDDDDDCFSPPPDPSFTALGSPPLIRPFRLTNALHTELEATLLSSNIHIGHESNSTFHPFVRGDRRCICTKGWEGHRPWESTGGQLISSPFMCVYDMHKNVYICRSSSPYMN